jgi:AraC family transcriptional regulator of adaptative response/methylated-DNA-[protein]-cysteine methyltransferase
MAATVPSGYGSHMNESTMTRPILNQERCWEALVAHDRSSDGRFFTGVLTTGIYCKPSCPSRRPLRRNVRFYATSAEAERDGLRPCLRCRPLDTEDRATQKVGDLCRHIEANPDAPLALRDLAERAGLSPFHLQRTFKSIVGITPKQFAEAARLRTFKARLKEGRNVTTALYDAGYGSSSRVYERADTRLGMTPNQYRQHGRDVAITYVAIESPLGLMMIGATDRGLCFVQFGEAEQELLNALKLEYPAATFEPMPEPRDPEFAKWIEALTQHLAGTRPNLDLPLDIRGTAFQTIVWTYLQSIPYGEVQSYSEVAAGIGQPAAARAVARACAGNKIAIAIPCHRVIRATGELGGYRWGLPRKRALIDRERSVAAQARSRS